MKYATSLVISFSLIWMNMFVYEETIYIKRIFFVYSEKHLGIFMRKETRLIAYRQRYIFSNYEWDLL
jgi:hypothetical protein